MKVLTEYEYGCLRNFMCLNIMCVECAKMNDGICLYDLFMRNMKLAGDEYHITDKFFKAFGKDFIIRQADRNQKDWEAVKKFFMTGATLV